MPGPWSTTRTTSRRRPARAGPGPAGPPPWRTAFSNRLAKARSSWAASAARGRSASSASRTVRPGRATPRRLEHAGQVDRLAAAARPCRTPGARRRAGSRPVARGARPSATTASLSSWRSSAVNARRVERGPGAMIEVSGVRRSCDTERSSAVFSSSLRRSAPASIASACIRSRSASAPAAGRQPVGLLAAALRLSGAGAGEPSEGCWRGDDPKRRRGRRRP